MRKLQASDQSISHLRVQFLEVRVDQPLLVHLDERAAALHKVALALKWTIIDLSHELDS